MTLGPGRYDDICTEIRERVHAKGGIVLIVMGGYRGPGFSAQLDLLTTISMPRILREVAQQIEDDLPHLGPAPTPKQ